MNIMGSEIQPKFPSDYFNEFDQLKITGHTIGYWQFMVSDFLCVAATVYDHTTDDLTEESRFCFKVWAADQSDPQLPAGHDNKFWFDFRTCKVEVIRRAEW